MTKARLNIIRQYIKSGNYFDAVAKNLDLIQRETERPTQKNRAMKLLVALRNDMRHLQQNGDIIKLLVVRKKSSAKNSAQI